ncbi:2Fe-2S iron-sulfur cluster-binding protein [Streptomyces sp. NPDC040750]|uniref:2Fe-2S iron-sulfur cluster-binding protein n=1 Tax=Streptomyces sp. NPDC040750 TaxID=3154491 RepID=UPI0034077625
MTDDQHGEGTPQGGGRWNPLPQGDYDDGATAFVKLPEGGIDALLSGDSPLAAPGHGYVPPQITVAPGAGDPAATGTWTTPVSGAQWPDPNAAAPAQAAQSDDRFTYRPGATQHWTFEDPAAAPGHDVTGQWSIPVAGGDLPDESGEYTTSALVEQWGGTPPATLPGGAPAPWATDGAGNSWAHQAEPRTPAPPDHPGAHPADPVPAPDGADGHLPDERYGHGRIEHGQVEHGQVDHGQTDTGHGDAGHDAVEHAEDRHAASGLTEAGRGDAHGAAVAREPAAGHDAPLPGPLHPAAAPETDAHGPADGAERPADGPAGHEEPTEPTAAPRAVTAADTDRAPGAGDADFDDRTDDDAHARVSEADPLPAAEDASEGAPDRAPDGSPDRAPGQAAAAGAEPDGEDAPDDASEDPAGTPLPPHDDHPLASYVLRVNGVDRPVTDAWIGESLLYVLRERLGLAGAKDGCSQGECGACNVQVDGRLVASCLVPSVTAAGSEVRTVEGLAADGHPSDVQRALARCGAVQCGFCVPGMAMTLHDLLEGNPAPSELETRQALCGNLCRCSGYRGVLEAVREVVAEREAGHADPESDADAARIPHQAAPGSGGVNPSAFEAPGAFDPPRTAPGGPQGAYHEPPRAYDDTAGPYGDAPDAYGDAPDVYGDAPDPYGVPAPHEQHYGQDGGQA